MFKALTKDHIDEIRGMPESEKCPCRFTKDGCGFNPITGKLCSRGSNVLYHPVFWTLTRGQGKRMAELTESTWVSCK